MSFVFLHEPRFNLTMYVCLYERLCDLHIVVIDRAFQNLTILLGTNFKSRTLFCCLFSPSRLPSYHFADNLLVYKYKTLV